MYYTGIGVFNFDGKDYGFGDKLPADLPNATIESMLAKGKASKTKPAEGSADTNSDEIGVLRDKVAGLTADLEQSQAEVKRLTGKLEQSQAEVDALMNAAAVPPAPAPAAPQQGAAGPKR